MCLTWFDAWVVFMGISPFKKKKKIVKIVCKKKIANNICKNLQAFCMFAKGVCSRSDGGAG